MIWTKIGLIFANLIACRFFGHFYINNSSNYTITLSFFCH